MDLEWQWQSYLAMSSVLEGPGVSVSERALVYFDSIYRVVSCAMKIEHTHVIKLDYACDYLQLICTLI